ncbi:hypothetical protein [Moorena sp. SIO3I8]|uniref:hypothetical protein n=1 Tax=Moorena sp. SIO3I8 TaxID=2607833 RepID=UPI0013C0935E|nr:hypothetical protein [Moorena sp. SIO3I8]NEO08444.1 hypothetical protein [Moorena sp. SIO3I8]
MGRKQKPQATVVSKSKRSTHHSGTLAKRSGQSSKSSNRAGEYAVEGQPYGDIIPASSGLRETVRTRTQEDGHNALAPERQSKCEATVKSIGFFGRRVKR